MLVSGTEYQREGYFDMKSVLEATKMCDESPTSWGMFHCEIPKKKTLPRRLKVLVFRNKNMQNPTKPI